MPDNDFNLFIDDRCVYGRVIHHVDIAAVRVEYDSRTYHLTPDDDDPPDVHFRAVNTNYDAAGDHDDDAFQRLINEYVVADAYVGHPNAVPATYAAWRDARDALVAHDERRGG